MSKSEVAHWKFSAQVLLTPLIDD